MSAFKPNAVATHDLGTSALPWNNIYVDKIITGTRSGGLSLEVGSESLWDSGNGTSSDLKVWGNLTVEGVTTTIESTTLVVEDPLIKLAKGNTSSDAVDIGFYGCYDDGDNGDQFAGLFRDATDDKFKLFVNLAEAAEPGTTVNVSGAGYTPATLVVGNLEVGTAVLPDADNGANLGSGTLGWSNLYLTDDGTISFLNEAANAVDLTLTHSGGHLTVSSTDKLCFGSTSAYINHDSTDLQLVGDTDINIKPTVDFLVGAGGNIILDADGNSVTFKAGNDDTTGLSWTQSASGTWTHKVTTEDADLIFNVNTSAGSAGDQEVLRLDGSAGSLLMNEEHKIEFRSTGIFAHSNAAGQFTLSSDGNSADAINIVASDSAGGIDIDAGTGGIAIDAGNGAISIGSEGADAGAINIGTSTGARTITVGHDNSTKVDVNATDIELDCGDDLLLTSAKADVGIIINSSDAAGGVQVLAGTGGIEINAVAAGAGSGNGALTLGAAAASSFSVAGGDLTLETTSSGNLSASAAGNIDIDGTSVTIDALDAGAINIGTSEGLLNDTSAINIGTSETARTITIGSDDSTKVDVNALAIELDSAGTVVVDAAGTSATAVDINSAGGIDITATGAANKDLVLGCTSGSIKINAGEAAADAILIDASTAGGGIDITAGNAANDANSDISIIASNSLTIDAQGTDSGDGVSITLGTDSDAAQFKISNNSASEKFKVDGSGAILASGTFTVGGDADGHDVKLFGATSGQYLLWDESRDELVLAGDTKLSFHDDSENGSEHIFAKEDGHLEINAGTTLDMTAPTVDINASTAVTIDTPAVTITDTTASSATEGGYLRLASNDGAALANDHRLGVIEFAAAEDASNTMTVGARIEAVADAAWSATENGAALVMYTTDGNASQSEVLRLDSDKLATFAGAVSVSGNLTVGGTTTTVNSTTLTVDDKNIELGSVDTPTNTTANGGGITLKGATDKTFNWVEAGASWTSSEDLDLVSGKHFSIAGTTVLDADGAAKVQSAVVNVANNGLAHNSGQLSLDLNKLAAATVDVAADSIAIVDANDSNGTKLERVSDLVTAVAGDGLTSVVDSGQLDVDITELTAADIASGDFIAFSDESETGDPTRKESIDDVATLFAGNGLAAADAVISVDLNQLSAATIDVAADSIAIIDADDSNGSKKESIVDLVAGVAGDGLAAGSGVLSVDITELTAAAIASGDFIAFSDEGESGDPTRKESIDDVATLFAGNGLAAADAVISVDLNQLSAATIDVAADSIVIVDADDSNGSKKESVADLVAGMAGTGISAASGQLSIAASHDHITIVKGDEATGSNFDINLSDSLTLNGVDGETNIILGTDAITIGLPNDVTIANDLDVTADINCQHIKTTGSKGVIIQKTTTSVGPAGNGGTATSNHAGSSITYETNADISDGTTWEITINNSRVLATSAIIATCGSHELRLVPHTINAATSFKLNLTNVSGSTIDSGAELVLNIVVL